MSEKKANRGALTKWIILLVAVLAILLAAVAGLLLRDKLPGSQPSIQRPAAVGEEEIVPEETAGIPLATKYIVLSYPAELEDQVTVSYEDMTDGQTVIFTTDFTGESLELFRFTISTADTDGYLLGTLKDAEAGELKVFMNVYDHGNGNLAPEEYAKLNAMQERVNDIIVQFHDDSRFTPNR